MNKKISLILFITFSLIISLFYLIPNKQDSKKERTIANINSAPENLSNFLGLSVEALFENIYSAGKTLSSIPYEIIKKKIIDHKLVSLIKEQNLDLKTESRILNHLNDKKYAAQLVAFLLEMKKNYLDEGSVQVVDFKDFIKNLNSNLSNGSTHSLFDLQKDQQLAKEKTQKDSDNSLISVKSLISTGLKLYDVLFIQNTSIIKNQGSNGIYKRLAHQDQDMVDQAVPIIENLLQGIIKGMKKGDIKDTLSIILSNENKLEATTISVIDFVQGLTTKYYYSFVSQFQRKKELSKWMMESYKGDQKDLIYYLKNSLEKKYAVQIVVDGLQGQLVKSLAKKDNANSVFIKQIYKDRVNAKSVKPKNISTIVPNHEPSLKFLKDRQKSSFSNKHYLSFFKDLYKNYPNSIAQQGLSSTPTISVRNIPLVETGAGVAGKRSTGIPNFHFYDRDKERAYYFFGNDVLLLNDLTKESGMKNMFNRLSKNNTINCNAIYDELAKQTYDGFLNLAIGEKSRDFGEKLCFNNLAARAKTEKILRGLKIKLLKNLKNEKNIINNLLGWLPFIGSKEKTKQLVLKIADLEDQGMPQYLLYYNPWPDHFAHFKGPFSDEIISSTGELARLDYWLSQLNAIYKDSGVLDKTLFAMAGDHGLTPIFFALNPEKIFDDFNTTFHRNIIVKKISSDEGEGAKINHSYKTEPIHPVDIIVASTAGGNYMMDFFAGQTKQERKRQVYYSDLIHWKPLDNKAPINIVQLLTSKLKETLDYLVIREAQSDLQESKTRIIAYRNNKLHNELLIRKKNKIYYETSRGDLLNIYSKLKYKSKLTVSEQNLKNSKIQKCLLQAKKEDVYSWCSEKEWRILTALTARPDSVVQLSHLYDLKRAGSINLFPKAGIGYNTIVPGRHAGESFHEKDAFVGFWGTPVQSSKVIKAVDNGILAPTIYEYLTGKKAIKGKNGWGYSSVLKQLIP